ncbi:hypothetical protein BO70DRAFT_143117 [Aspergillus heteromorphus CBS 117.55]|uniref:Uncharacterized protein n=1 Tax=Aspergillus heteromorphus CBS 117.55 TaxID=1448321 RepID=A0A317VAZ0_9EURO|nr:uncharacterized protein BO70DRAFT_143117 [Aspergillus heteromorphus CBS 117.55]PWY70237.1 hypothetical protein BO70DRAFT_143117 [Aspergillus heteromorphus CBS 117.55]
MYCLCSRYRGATGPDIQMYRRLQPPGRMYGEYFSCTSHVPLMYLPVWTPIHSIHPPARVSTSCILALLAYGLTCLLVPMFVFHVCFPFPLSITMLCPFPLSQSNILSIPVLTSISLFATNIILEP